MIHFHCKEQEKKPVQDIDDMIYGDAPTVPSER